MMRKVLLDLKSIRKTLYFMALLAWGILPMINRYQTQGLPVELSFGITMRQMQMLLPVACSVPVALLLRCQLEEGCAEPIHAFPAVTKQGPFALLATEAILLIGLCLPLFGLFSKRFAFFPWQELLRTAAQGFFLQNLAFAAGYLTHFSLAGLGTQVLAAGAMQLPFLDVNTEGSLSRMINIYSAVSDLTPRPWEPLRISLTASCAVILWFIGSLRTKNYMDHSIFKISIEVACNAGDDL